MAENDDSVLLVVVSLLVGLLAAAVLLGCAGGYALGRPRVRVCADIGVQVRHTIDICADELTVDALRARLHECGGTKQGTKTELVHRLRMVNPAWG